MAISTEKSINTAVNTGKLNTTLDIENIFRYLEIDDVVKGTKYHGMYKGVVNTNTSCFFNQITINAFARRYNKIISVKFFLNGCYQITGIKYIEQSIYILKKLLKRIMVIKGSKEVEVILDEGILYDREDYDNFFGMKKTRFEMIKIYNHDNKIIGYRKGNDFIINGRKVMLYRDNFICKEPENFKKKVFNYNGDYLGYYHYTFSRKVKVLRLNKNAILVKEDTFTYKITNKFKNDIGYEIFYPNEDYEGPTSISGDTREYTPEDREVITFHYSAIQNKDVLEELQGCGDFQDIVNCKVSNANFSFNLLLGGRVFNKKKLCETLVNEFGLCVFYELEGNYQTINVKLFYDKDMNMLYKTKVFEHRITVMIFNNGKVGVCGCKSYPQMDQVKAFLDETFEIISTRDVFTGRQQEVEIKNENLTIYDLI